MAFKMKGFPFAGKSPIKDIQGDGTPEGTNHHHNNKHYDGMEHDKDGKWIEEAKPPPNKQKERHPLYNELTKEEKAKYDKLSDKEKLAITL